MFENISVSEHNLVKQPNCKYTSAQKITDLAFYLMFNTLTSGWFWQFSEKNSSFQLLYQRPSSSVDCARELFNGSNRSASLVDCTRKKFFGWGCGFFMSDVVNEVVLGSFRLMLPGLGPNR